MFQWAGAQIMQGVISHFEDGLKQLTPQSAEEFLSQCPIIKQLLSFKDVLGQLSWDAYNAYLTMSPAQKQQFWQDIELAGAKLAAKLA